MKKSNRLGRIIAGGFLSLAMVGLPASVWAAGNTDNTSADGRAQQEITAMREKMLADSKAYDAALEKMVAQLNQAPESRKTDLEAAILTKMVQQQHQTLNDWEALRAHLQQLQQEQQGQGQSPTGRSAPAARQ